MRRFVLLAGMAVTLAGAAAADTLDALYKNTLTLTDTRGGVYTLLVSEDGKMEQTNSAGTWAAGFWTKTERGFCWTARGAATLCIAMPDDKGIGDTWEIRGPTGVLSWTAAIVEGRADLKAANDAAGHGDH